MVDFFDRDSERKQVFDFLNTTDNRGTYALWIEGISGAGKTEFLKYIISASNIPVFKILDIDEYYKCEKVNMQTEFEYISNIIYTMQKKSPFKMEKYIHTFFSKQEHLSLLDACMIILPQIKYLKSISQLLYSKYQISSKSQNIIADKITSLQLIDFFSNLIIYFLDEEYKNKNVLFCIDDIQWLDLKSMKVLEKIIQKIKINNIDISIAFFCTARKKGDLPKLEKEIFLYNYSCMKENVDEIKCIFIKNFGLKTVREIIHKKGRSVLENRIEKIFEVTQGNAQELEQTLRFCDSEINSILSDYENHNMDNVMDTNFFSREQVLGLYTQNKYNAHIINFLALLACRISKILLFKFIQHFYQVHILKTASYTEFDEAMEYLINNGIIEENNAGINLAHDSIKSIGKELIEGTGELIEYANIAVDILVSIKEQQFNKLNSNIRMALELLLIADPIRGQKEFIDYLENKLELIDTEIFVLGAKCFCNAYSDSSIEIAEKYVIPIILPALVNTFELSIAQDTCSLLYRICFNAFSKETQINFLILFIKVQIDLSVINKSNAYDDAITLYEKLEKYEIQNKNTKLHIFLLGMAAYEHVLKYEKINALANQAEELLYDNNYRWDDKILSIYYRNHGLFKAHTKLKKEYNLAIKYANNIASASHKAIHKGTALNNLGLSYYYSGDIKKAIEKFEKAKEILSDIGYDTIRIINNLAMCYVIENDINKAYEYLTEAMASQITGVFMKACINTNYALVLSMLGMEEESDKILNEYIKEYNEGNARTPDSLLYCAAFINQGYNCFKKQDYFGALKQYKISCFHTYRFENELQLQKRKNMIKLCLQAEDCYNQHESIEMDLDNESHNYYLKPYSTVLFAYYVI